MAACKCISSNGPAKIPFRAEQHSNLELAVADLLGFERGVKPGNGSVGICKLLSEEQDLRVLANLAASQNVALRRARNMLSLKGR